MAPLQAGLQDRVIQTYEGCMYMDFDRDLLEQRGYGDYVRPIHACMCMHMMCVCMCVCMCMPRAG